MIKFTKIKPTEAALWKRIKSKLNVGEYKAYRVEAVATPGFPDVVWASPIGIELIELKAGPLKFQQSQKRMFNDMIDAGVVVYIIWQEKARDEPLVYEGYKLIDPEYEDEGETLDEWLKGYMKYVKS